MASQYFHFTHDENKYENNISCKERVVIWLAYGLIFRVTPRKTGYNESDLENRLLKLHWNGLLTSPLTKMLISNYWKLFFTCKKCDILNTRVTRLTSIWRVIAARLHSPSKGQYHIGSPYVSYIMCHILTFSRHRNI